MPGISSKTEIRYDARFGAPVSITDIDGQTAIACLTGLVALTSNTDKSGTVTSTTYFQCDSACVGSLTPITTR